MNFFAKTALVAVSLLLSVSPGFSADVKNPATDLKGAAKPVGEGVKAAGKASTVVVKENAAGKAADAKASTKAKIVDVNTATEAELKAVPGIGDIYAAKIIAGRPYANKAQLKSRKVIPSTLYEQVKELLIAKQPKK